jgi:hypothetical protein
VAGNPDPGNPSHRTRAHQLRKASRGGQTLHESDQLWLADYEEKQQRKRVAAVAAPVETGRSKSARRIDLQIEEAAEAEGTGPTAAAVAAGAALAAREEGRRIDSLSMHAVDALKEAVLVYRDICLTMRRRMENLEHAHVEMLETIRVRHIEATQLEANLVQRDAEARPEDQMLTMLIAKFLNVPPEMLPRAAPPPTRPTRPNGKPPTRPNGVPPK